MTRSALLLLADSRFPAGAYAHSGGLEAAAGDGRVHDAASLREFLIGRLHGAALVSASFAAAAVSAARDQNAAALAELDHEYEVRLISSSLRTASRQLGKQLVRTARAAWPGPRMELLARMTSADMASISDLPGPQGPPGSPRPAGPADPSAATPPEETPAFPGEGPHHPVALGAVCFAAELSAEEAAMCAVQQAVSSPALAAVRLLGLDPCEVTAVLANLSAAADKAAARALTLSRMALLKNDLGMLPSLGSPLLDLAAEDHATWEVRFFAA